MILRLPVGNACMRDLRVSTELAVTTAMHSVSTAAELEVSLLSVPQVDFSVEEMARQASGLFSVPLVGSVLTLVIASLRGTIDRTLQSLLIAQGLLFPNRLVFPLSSQSMVSPDAPITNFVLLYATTEAPHGYEPLRYAHGRSVVNLNEGTKGPVLYLYYTRMHTRESFGKILPLAPITELTVLCATAAGDRQPEPLPAGFEAVPGDLNKGAGGPELTLAVRRGCGPAIKHVSVVVGGGSSGVGDDREKVPPGHTLVPKDLNRRSDGGLHLSLCFQRLAVEPTLTPQTVWNAWRELRLPAWELPISDLRVLYTDARGGRAREELPPGHTLIDVDLNPKTGGRHLFFFFFFFFFFFSTKAIFFLLIL